MTLKKTSRHILDPALKHHKHFCLLLWEMQLSQVELQSRQHVFLIVFKNRNDEEGCSSFRETLCHQVLCGIQRGCSLGQTS